MGPTRIPAPLGGGPSHPFSSGAFGTLISVTSASGSASSGSTRPGREGGLHP